MYRKFKSDTLSPIQHLILTAAVSHPGHRLARPEDIKPPTYRSALRALRRRGFVIDSVAEDGSGRRSAAPVLSEAGFAHVAPATHEVQTVAKPELPTVRSPRAGSKLDRLVAMLARPDGAGSDELVGALGWLPHTTRAALIGLRKRGWTCLEKVESSFPEGGGFRWRTGSRPLPLSFALRRCDERRRAGGPAAR